MTDERSAAERDP